MVGSLPVWPGLLGVPFLPLSVASRGLVATGLVVLAEVAFWGGACLAGPDAVKRIRAWWSREASGLGERGDPKSEIRDPESGI